MVPVWARSSSTSLIIVFQIEFDWQQRRACYRRPLDHGRPVAGRPRRLEGGLVKEEASAFHNFHVFESAPRTDMEAEHHLALPPKPPRLPWVPGQDPFGKGWA